MIAFAIFVVVVCVVVALAAQGGQQDPHTGKREMSTAQKIGLGIAAVVAALGLLVVGFIAFFMIGMANWANNK